MLSVREWFCLIVSATAFNLALDMNLWQALSFMVGMLFFSAWFRMAFDA